MKAIVTLMEQPGSRAATSAEANDKVRKLISSAISLKGLVLLASEKV